MCYESLRQITEAQGWRQVAESLVRGGAPATSLGALATYWIEAGHRIREQVADDRLLCQMLRLTTPPYRGAGLTLYRGENADRWNAGAVGLAWTLEIEVARMFARGLNAVGSGGVLLAGRFGSTAIIIGPNEHSAYLQEHQYTVDPSLVEDLQVLECYPPA